jgi:hypothetical protein
LIGICGFSLRDCAKVSHTEVDVFQEPACWGSGEIVLIPASLERALRGGVLGGLRVVGTKRKPTGELVQVALDLSVFTKVNWVQTLKGHSFDSDHASIIEGVVAGVSHAFERNPDAFDVSVLTKPLDRIDGIMDLPFESRTWEVIDRLNITTAVDLVTLISGTFREIHDRLGDTRAALDVSVTADSWLVQAQGGSWSFSTPVTSLELEELKKLARIRAFRTCGLDPTLSSYTPELADVLPRNWSIAQAERWTLERCGDELGLSRERIRQMTKMRLFEPARRRWTRSSAILDLSNEYRTKREEQGDPELTASIRLLRSEASALLLAYGYSEEFLRSAPSLLMALRRVGYRLHELRRVAYRSSERVGFVLEETLKNRLQDEFPSLDTSMLNDVLAALISIRDLPHGYVYVEGAARSFFTNDVVRLLGLRGRLPFEEVYAAASRFYRVRVPGYVFPPRAVRREFFQRDDRVWIEGETIDLVEATPHHLSGVQLWVEERISEATGGVVHRSTLWDLARRDGISPGTLTVYFGYSLYFKPMGKGCLTHTGSFPGDEMIEIAAAKGSMIRVPARLLGWKAEGSYVIVDLEVGTETVDSGLFSPPAAVRRLIQPMAFRVMTDGAQRGNVGWSGNILYGFSSGLFARGVAPGDHLRMAFDIVAKEVDLLDHPEELPVDD